MKNLCALVLLVTAMTITGCAEKKPAAPPAPPAPAADPAAASRCAERDSGDPASRDEVS